MELTTLNLPRFREKSAQRHRFAVRQRDGQYAHQPGDPPLIRHHGKIRLLSQSGGNFRLGQVQERQGLAGMQLRRLQCQHRLHQRVCEPVSGVDKA